MKSGFMSLKVVVRNTVVYSAEYRFLLDGVRNRENNESRYERLCTANKRMNIETLCFASVMKFDKVRSPASPANFHSNSQTIIFRVRVSNRVHLDVQT